jgi:multidrug efflux system outer membrane protein
LQQESQGKARKYTARTDWMKTDLRINERVKNFFFIRQGVVLIIAALFVFFGCAVGPNYKRPAVSSPTSFRGETETTTNSFADLPWWQIFHDPRLQELIRLALTNNFDLRTAFSREEEARQSVIATRAELFPQLQYQAIAARGKNVLNVTPFPGTATGDYFVGEGEATWELDLWGRVRRLTEAQRAQYLATQEARRDLTISLIAQIAQDYFQLLALDQQLELAHETTNSFGQSLKLFSEQLKGGVASKLETSSAEALLESAAETIPELERQIAIQEDQLSVLVGEKPGVIERENSMLEKQVSPEIPAGIPSSLLERRPDVREAEEQVRSANAQVGVAVANFFPQISLTALLGKVSPALSGVTAGSANAWGIAADLAGPIFEGGRLRAQYREAKAAREQSTWQYYSTILTAFQEVSDALISHEKFNASFTHQTRAVAAYQVAVRVATERYRLGNASYYEILQEQQDLFPAENTLVQIQLNQMLSVVQLYRALGGGWDVESASHS